MGRSKRVFCNYWINHSIAVDNYTSHSYNTVVKPTREYNYNAFRN